MKRISLKEVLLLILPTLILLSASFWWQKREQRDAVKESGPFRLEVAKVEKVTLTPAEVAEGYDTKFLVTFAYWGKGSSLVHLDRSWAAESVSVLKTNLLERNEKKWRPVSAEVFPAVRTEGYYMSPEIGKMQTALLLPLSKLPNKDLQVQFFLNGHSGLPSSPILSTTLSVPVRKAGEAAPIPQVSRECSLLFQSVRVDHLRPVTQLSTRGKLGVDRTVEFEVKTQRRTSRRQYPNNNWKTFNACIVDEKGKIYRKWLGSDKYGPLPQAHFIDFIRSQINPAQESDVYRFEYSFSTAFIPASAGRLTFKAQVSENGEWPLPLSVVVREKDDWRLKRARTLKLKSIETQPNPDDASKLDVIVKVIPHNYRGMYQLNDLMPESHQVEGKPKGRFLITNWSQRLENSRSSAPSLALIKVNSSGYYPIRMESVSSTANGWKITYPIALIRLKNLSDLLAFKADIGVEGDGFLPVSIALPISKKP
jgi:hypothetical protein